MKTILITGLDGSGKSTLLKKLDAQAPPRNYELIFVPEIQLSALPEDTLLLQTAQFVNFLNQQADTKELPALKAIALFASMLLFPELLVLAQERNPQRIYCERHPLVDTVVYAQFYGSRVGAGSVSPGLLSGLDQQFSAELNYLLEKLPKAYLHSEKGPSEQLLIFIFQWFFVEKKLGLAELEELFGLSLPDTIYFLWGDAKIFFDRIKDRKQLEAHETLPVMQQLEQAYDAYLRELRTIDHRYPVYVEAEDFGELDRLYAALRQGKEF